MAKLRLSFACREYDRTRPLLDGSLEPEGVELYGLALEPPECFRRMIRDQEFDVSEMSLCSYTILHSRGESPFIAIPVFPYRVFRHGFIFINADAGIREPQDLRGRRIGLPEYTQTATVWIRGLLQHEYDVPQSSVHWFLGGQDEPSRHPAPVTALPEGVQVESIPANKTLSAMLEAGEIDALGTPSLPLPFRRGSPKVKRLFPNFREVEEAYFKKTGLFPMMHTVVIKNEIYREHPWVAVSLYKALEEAKRRCYQKLASLPYDTLVWVMDEVERERRLMGDDYYPYGFEANRHTLEVFTQYMLEQGLTPRKVDPRELFAPNTLERS
ncbi:MAG TPA: ABC transporter substrate-binding protein [Dehalococcoidia bacterium]|nr:ABC transporter substrate-binding protein [Dehalococcoidia bacterium]